VLVTTTSLPSGATRAEINFDSNIAADCAGNCSEEIF
jgi:hypothetical protein